MSVVLRPASGRSLLLAAAAALAAFSVSATDADASAERSGPDAVRIAAPVTDGLVTTDQVRVELKTAPDITRVHVYAGPKDVSSHFARRGGAWTGTLPRSLFKAGANRLLVHAYAGKRSAGTDAHSFILSRDAAVQTTVRSGGAAEARMSAGPAATKSYAPTPGTIPVSVHTGTPSVAELTVNGHRVADLRATRFLNDHSYLVSSEDGLRPGVNRLVLSTHDRAGRHAVKRWTIDRSAALPLAEAGPRERVTHKGDWTHLDATASRPTAKGASLRYRWRVVSAPAGAKPVLQWRRHRQAELQAGCPRRLPGRAERDARQRRRRGGCGGGRHVVGGRRHDRRRADARRPGPLRRNRPGAAARLRRRRHDVHRRAAVHVDHRDGRRRLRPVRRDDVDAAALRHRRHHHPGGRHRHGRRLG